MSEQEILEALRSVKYPGFTRDIVSFGIVRDVHVEGDGARLRLELSPGTPPDVASRIEEEARRALGRIGLPSVQIHTALPTIPGGMRPMRAASAPLAPPVGDEGLLPKVKHTVAVASGKGGVGKSTVAVNLAVALAARGARAGLLDADIYGPSIPLMMGTDEKPRLGESGRCLVPFERFGVRFMSLGFLVEKDAAVIWRGPMVMKAVSQLLADVDWGELDVLVVDMPPGTGDAQLTLSQKVRLAGAIIVTTPQDVALADAIKGVAMFRKVGVNVLGLVENMSVFACPHCGARTDIFGHGGGRAEAERLKVPFLGEIAIESAIRASGDRGIPIVAADPDSAPAAAFLAIADSVLRALGGSAREAEPRSAGFLDRLRRGWGPKGA